MQIFSSILCTWAASSPLPCKRQELQWRFAQCKTAVKDFPGGPVVKNPPSSSGVVGPIPRWGTNIPHAMGQLNLCVTTRESAHCNKRGWLATTTQYCQKKTGVSPYSQQKEKVRVCFPYLGVMNLPSIFILLKQEIGKMF